MANGIFDMSYMLPVIHQDNTYSQCWYIIRTRDR